MTHDPEHQAFDELLVLAWQQGNRAAGERLAARWHPRLWRHARLLTRSADEASDATQAAWVSITRDIKSLRDPARFAAFAYRIVTRRCADTARRAKRQRRSGHAAKSSTHNDQPPGQRPHDQMRDDADERRRAVRAALDAVPGQDRAVLLLAYVDGLPLRTIAEIFSVPVGTVKSRLHAARRRLAALLDCDDPRRPRSGRGGQTASHEPHKPHGSRESQEPRDPQQHLAAEDSEQRSKR